MSKAKILTDKPVTPVLELQIEREAPSRDHVPEAGEFNKKVLPGQFIYIQMDHLRDLQPYVPLLLGLESSKSGQVRFYGMDWHLISYDLQFRLRSQIGRVFAGPAWIQNLTVAENIWLAQLNQGVDRARIKERINEWLPRLAGEHAEAVSKSLGRRPAFVIEPILQICQLIRAFAFKPRMLILESPLRVLPHGLHRDLIKTIQDLNDSGCATVWFDLDRAPELLTESMTIRRWAIRNEALVDCEAA